MIPAQCTRGWVRRLEAGEFLNAETFCAMISHVMELDEDTSDERTRACARLGGVVSYSRTS